MAKITVNGTEVEKVYVVPMSDVHFPWEWNSRTRQTVVDPTTNKRVIPSASPDAEKAAGDEGILGLYTSLDTVGQKDPIIVRPNVDAKGATIFKTKAPYACVSGFSRGDCLGLIADKNGDKAPMVKIIVRELTEAQAREENLRENTGGRAPLSGPDLLFGIQAMRANEKDITPGSIAKRLGKSERYIGTLCAIANGAKASNLLDRWRSAKVSIPYVAMSKIASLPTAEEQEKAFADIARPAVSTTASGVTVPKGGADVWVGTALKQAADIGFKLGFAEKSGGIRLQNAEFFKEYVDVFVKVKDAPTSVAKGEKGEADYEKRLADAVSKHKEFRKAIVAEFKAAHKKGLEYVEPVAEPKAEKAEKAEKKAAEPKAEKKAAAAKNVNGKPATA